MPPDDIAVKLAASEWQFVITTLKNTSAILLALASLRDVLPDGFEIPVTSETISNIAGMARSIERQTKTS